MANIRGYNIMIDLFNGASERKKEDNLCVSVRSRYDLIRFSRDLITRVFFLFFFY